MNSVELSEIIQRSESSKVQFKERMPHPDSLAQELIAFQTQKAKLMFSKLMIKQES